MINIKKNENFYMMHCMDDTTSMHTHDFLELVYVVGGTSRQIINNKKVIIKKGDYFFVDYGTEHGYEHISTDGFEIVNCLFYPEFIDGALQGCRSFQSVLNNYLIKFNQNMLAINPADFIFKDYDNNALTFINNMFYEFNEKKAGYLEIIRSELIKLIIYAMREYVDKTNEAYDKISSYIIDEINSSYSKNISLGMYSEKLCYSLPHLSRKFKETTGKCFRDFLRDVRIEQGCRLLANTNKKIIDIAQSVGYCDVNSFSETFKKCMGITPRDFRKKTQNKPVSEQL